ALLDAARRIGHNRQVTFVLALAPGFKIEASRFWERIRSTSIQVIEGKTWDVLAHSDLALAASGTVTIEAALLGVPLVTFYRVNELSWRLGRWMVRAPFLSMVNLVAERRLAPELIQNEATGERIAAEAVRLLEDDDARAEMRAGLAEVAARLSGKLGGAGDPMETAAAWIEKVFSERQQTVHAD
ncbi:MAG: lipid-A-disaccharide synthase, partial [Bryobacteraceae bacterium]